MAVTQYYGGRRIRAVKMDDLKGLLGIRRMDKVPNARIRQLCGMTRVWMKRLMKVFSDGLAMWKGSRTTGLLRALCRRVG